VCCDDCVKCAGTSVQIIEVVVELLVECRNGCSNGFSVGVVILIDSGRSVWSQPFSFNDRDRRSEVGYCFL
jgi:hypothetical protein